MPLLVDVTSEARRESQTISVALRHATALAAALSERHYIVADLHELASGKVAVSVYHDLVVYVSDKGFSWRSPERTDNGRPMLTYAVGLPMAVKRIAEHYEILINRRLADALGSMAALLTDRIVSGYVCSR